MNDQAAPPPPPLKRDRAGRVARLALKELRETLRDRRTILTLVLMPLLVYPVLSLAFRQFLLSSFQQQSGEWIIVTHDEEQLVALHTLLAKGEQLLDERGQSVAEPGAPNPPLDSIQMGYDSQHDLGELVRQNGCDVAVRVRPRGPPLPGGAYGFADFDLIFRPDNPISRQAARYIERRLQAVNDDYARRKLAELGDKTGFPAQWKRIAVAEKEGQAFGLATIVPLILILMTITGAVYPAIDLTAGERERGTLEALMAAPVPRLSLLFAKYLAVVTVATLTAVVNVLGMTITVFTTGLAPVLFGERGLSLGAVGVVFALLILFTAFFAAVLLCVTSFARSFKEAQAYLIPLMLVSLAPGLLSVMPGLQLNSWLAVAPLANIVLLARDVLEGDAHPLWGMVAVVTTALYGTAALGLAARVFGGDAILYGSQGSWNDLWRRPESPSERAALGDALTVLALIVPLYVVLNGALVEIAAVPMTVRLGASAGVTILLFLAIPLAAARWQLVRPGTGLGLTGARLAAFAGGIVLGFSLWPFAYELIIFSREAGLTAISEAQLAQAKGQVDLLLAEWRAASPLVVLGAVAIAPAVCEELFFRGYLLGAMRGRLAAWLAIAFVAVIFGVFHAAVGGLISVERVLSSTALGLVLGWIAWTTRSIFPGMLAHALHNGLMASLAYWGDGLQSLGLDVEGQKHLPLAWIGGAVLIAGIGAVLVFLGRARGTLSPEAPAP
ncbi:MAG: ABC transporter permease subunit/CPBP intramembrane protease [Pirellulaceae bacterium]|nr:ABC transporter permease subunit/CPBP intramembrane protease [Pirellulaceae bacterium]